MKSTIFTLSLSFAFLLGKAQITITQNDLPSIGTLVGLVEDTMPVNIFPGAAGANQFWDLSNIQVDDTSGADFDNPANVTGNSYFPNANLAIPDSLNTGGTFFSSSSTTFDLHGVYTDFGYGPMPINFIPAETWLTFPSIYQTTFSGTSKYEIAIPYSQPPVDSVKVISTTNFSSIIDGWGTITTPDYSTINCLRQQFTEIKTDSTFIHYFGIWASAGAPTYDTVITYRWWSNDAKLYIAEVITDQNGSVTKASYLINTAPFCTLIASAISTDETGFNFNDGTATVTASAGITPYYYNWSNGAATSSVSGLAPGTYYVTVTDAINCAVYDTIVVDPYVCAFSVSASSSDETSFNGDNGSASVVTSGGNSPFSYAWSNGGNTATVTGLAPGNYSVTVTDNNGCSDSDSATVNPYVCSLALSLASTDETSQGANDGTATATVSGGTSPYSYSWSNGGSQSQITNLPAQIYSVTVTDSANCTISGSIIVNGGGCTLIIDSVIATDNSCNGDSSGSLSVYVSGGTSPYAYNWSNGDNQANLSNLTAQIYSLTVSDAGSCFVSASASVTEPTPLSVSVSATNASCAGVCDGSVAINATGGTSPYAYSGGGNNLCAGNYLVTVSDANGCTVSDSAVVTEPAAITVTLSISEASCNAACDGSVSATATGGTSPYTYSGAGNNLCAGNYPVTATDANGCAVTDTAVVSEPAAMTINSIETDVNCNGDNDGAINLTVSGGTAPYSYLWSNSAITEDISGLVAGTYNVTVTDSLNCISTGNAIISAINPVPTVNLGPDVIFCDTVFINAGSGFVSYLWSDGFTGQIHEFDGFTGTLAVSVTVTDINGCSNSDTINITRNLAISLSLSATPDSGGADGSASVSVSGGLPPYGYAWSTFPVQTTPTITALASGTYYVTVTDSSGCTETDSVFVSMYSGIRNSTLYSEIYLYPNPVDDALNISIPLSSVKQVRIMLINSTGREIQLPEKEIAKDEDLLIINTGNFSSGIYYLKIDTGTGQPGYYRFIKM